MRRALVVGAAQGIGLETARHLQRSGHRVTGTWNRTEPPDDESIIWARCDITAAVQVDDLFAAADGDPYGVVVANAALVRDRLSSRMTDEDFAAVTDVNLAGTFRVARAALGPMAAARWGRLVLMSSVGGWWGNAGQANYAAAKAGQLGMARALAREVGPRGVTVNVVAPGPIDTELIASMSPKLRKRWLAMVPAQRMGAAADVAATVGFLSSERAGFITGALVPVDGGVLGLMRSGTRVVITGLGTVSAAGTDLDEFWAWVSAAPPAPVSTPVAEFDPREFMTAKAVRRSDPFARYGVGAARLALSDAALDPSKVPARRGAVVLSTVYGALELLEAEREVLRSDGADAVSPNLPVASCENVAAAMVSADVGWRGPSRTIVTACAGGTHAVGEGADLVAAGRADVALVGGTQGAITPVLMAAYANLRVLSPSGWVRPFDQRRDGFVFAEGAACLVLEGLEHATARGARIYAEVLGSGHTNDAASLVSPSGSGAVECITDALDDAALDPADVVAVNAHGTGTLVNDRREAEGLHEVFGASPPPVSSIKRVLGHAAGASGAFEAVAAALTAYTGVAPSLGTDVEPDPELDLDLIVGPPRDVGRGPVLSNSFGLGGHNGCLIVGPV